MIDIDADINKLKIQENIKRKLKNNKLNIIKDIWRLKRKDLKNLDFNDSEIKEIIISLQLIGLDLDRKIYD